MLDNDAMDMPETELSDFAMSMATVAALVKAQVGQYERLAEASKQMALMSGGVINLEISEGFTATAELLKDSYKEMVEGFDVLPEADAIKELMDAMKLHHIWVMK